MKNLFFSIVLVSMLITAGCVGGDQKSSDTQTSHNMNVTEIVNDTQQEP